MWTALRADRTGRSGRREPIVAVASWAGLDLFRPIAALYAAQLAYRRHAEMVRPWLAAVIIGVLLLWSLAMLLYRKRTAVTIVLETIIAGGAIIASMFVDTPANIADGVPTLPSMWPAGTVLGAAVLLGVRGGLLTAVIIGVADLIHVGFAPTSNTLHNIVLLLLLGGLFGLAVDLARDGQQRLEAVLAEQERLRERERLSRAVHDGVLQALAFIHRRGTEIGGESAELADLAAEQERSLRELVSRSRAPAVGRGDVDLRIGLAELEGPDITVVTPAAAVVVPHHTGEEVLAAVRAALDNVARHAGPGARAWVLLESTRGSVRVTVRDNGTGMAAERLAEAEAEGRLGATQSIRARMSDLGGSATWRSRPGAGCTVVLDVPVDAHQPI
ncbi:MAG TPA: histidine kinase [Intrasporangiaceae bacterium]|nr:histidine kinase [Intrasporangiaceae bacterium]